MTSTGFIDIKQRRFPRKRSFYWNLRAKNGEIVATSNQTFEWPTDARAAAQRACKAAINPEIRPL